MAKTAMLIRETLPGDAKAVSVLVDAVARERRYLAGTAGFSEESTASFIAFVKAAKGVHLVALLTMQSSVGATSLRRPLKG